MISTDDVKKLAALARIKLTLEEETSLAGDMENILGYVQQLQDVSAEQHAVAADANAARNVLRPDEAPHERGAYSEDLLAAAPARQGQHVKVKKIL